MRRTCPQLLVLTSSALGALGSTLVLADARAQDSPRAPVYVQIGAPCAQSQAQGQLLIDELRVRLPESTPVLLGSPEIADTARWRLSWVEPVAQGPCQLILSDVEPVVTIPLSRDAEPSAMREALVRLAWFISTTPPRAPLPSPRASLEGGDKPPAGPDQASSLTPPTTLPEDELNPRPDPSATPPADKPPADKAASVSKTTTTQDADLDQALRAAQQLLAALQSLRVSEPNLFGSLDRSLGPTFPETVFGAQSALGVHAGLSSQVTLLNSRPAWLTGAHLGWSYSQQLNLGVSYRGLTSDLRYTNTVEVFDPEDQRTFREQRLDLSWHAAALDADYMLFPDSPVHLTLGLSLGLGYARAYDLNISQDAHAATTYFVMTDLNAHLLYDLAPWMQAGFGLTVRGVMGDLETLGTGFFSVPAGSFFLRVSLF